MRYLLQWSDALFGRSGFSMSGISPLSWTTLDAWARRTRIEPDAEDIDALFLLDAVRLNPDPPKKPTGK